MLFKRSFFSQIFYVLIILFNSVFHGYHQLNPQSKLLIESRFKDKFLANNLNTLDFTSFNESLAELQRKILNARNNDCTTKELSRVNETKWLELLAACDELDASINTDVNLEKVLESFDEMVSSMFQLNLKMTDFFKNFLVHF